MAGFIEKAAPAVEPVAVADVKLLLGIEHALDDALLSVLIKAAREYCERLTQRALAERSFTLSLDRFEAVEAFPLGPVKTVDAVRYVDPDGNPQTLAGASYQFDAFDPRGRLVLASGESWPATAEVVNAVEIDFTTEGGAPETAQLAIKLLVKYWFESPDLIGQVAAKELGASVSALLAPLNLGKYR